MAETFDWADQDSNNPRYPFYSWSLLYMYLQHLLAYTILHVTIIKQVLHCAECWMFIDHHSLDWRVPLCSTRPKQLWNEKQKEKKNLFKGHYPFAYDQLMHQVMWEEEVIGKEIIYKKFSKKKEGSPDDTSQWCSSKVITSEGCKQSPRSWGDKN